jgi:hypothetical protein
MVFENDTNYVKKDNLVDLSQSGRRASESEPAKTPAAETRNRSQSLQEEAPPDPRKKKLQQSKTKSQAHLVDQKT